VIDDDDPWWDEVEFFADWSVVVSPLVSGQAYGIWRSIRIPDDLIESVSAFTYTESTG
jgi:hypothetical protein